MINLNSFIGISQHTQELRQLIQVIGPGESTVLVLGDSGTGKEVVANAIHNCSARASGPFVPVNCGAIPKDLLESELFGHRKGSFTGAISDRKGRFQLANKGTLFLDEIGDIGKGLQQALLRAIETGEIQPVGSFERKIVKVRIIAATNRNLEDMVERGVFREDLYYRLNVVIVNLPPLRERTDDIGLLAFHFLKQYSAQNKKQIDKISSGALKLLENYFIEMIEDDDGLKLQQETEFGVAKSVFDRERPDLMTRNGKGPPRAKPGKNSSVHVDRYVDKYIGESKQKMIKKGNIN